MTPPMEPRGPVVKLSHLRLFGAPGDEESTWKTEQGIGMSLQKWKQLYQKERQPVTGVG